MNVDKNYFFFQLILMDYLKFGSLGIVIPNNLK